MLNDRGDPIREIAKRKSECMAIMTKLDPVWKHLENPTRWKLIVWDAIIRSKLMYGLESLQLNKDLREDLDVFQRKGLRQILKVPTTNGQMMQGHSRTWTIDRIYGLVNAKINAWENRRIS